MDLTDSDRPHRRSALVCKELARFNVDIAALSETRLAGEGNVKEAEYTIFWSGKSASEPRIHGVGLAIKTRLAEQQNLAPIAINERIMTVRVPLASNNFMSVIAVYAPTLVSDDDVKECFYDQKCSWSHYGDTSVS